MAYSVVPTVISGDSWTAGNQNTYVRDNFKAGIPDIFTAAGDIAYGTAENAATNLALSAARKRLLVNEDGTGVEWRGIIGCQVSIAGSFKFTRDTTVIPGKVSFDAEDYDTSNMWDISNPDAIIIPYNGVYRISGMINYTQTSGGANQELKVTIGPNDKRIFWRRVINIISGYYGFNYVGVFNAGDDVYLRVTVYNSVGYPQEGRGTYYSINYIGNSL